MKEASSSACCRDSVAQSKLLQNFSNLLVVTLFVKGDHGNRGNAIDIAENRMAKGGLL
jgi:hypothetical protein